MIARTFDPALADQEHALMLVLTARASHVIGRSGTSRRVLGGDQLGRCDPLHAVHVPLEGSLQAIRTPERE